MGIHAIDTARYLLGDPEPVRVRASIGTAFGDYEVDDDGIVLVDWSDGARSAIESGWWAPQLGGLEADTELYGTGYAHLGAGRAAARLRPLRPAHVRRADGRLPAPHRTRRSIRAAERRADGRDRPGGARDRRARVRVGPEHGLKLVLGIDAGGTTTDAIVCTADGAVVGVGSAGPGNWEEIGVEAAIAAIVAATESAGTEPRKLHSAGLALAGVDFPGDAELLDPALKSVGMPRRLIVNDAFAALRAGSPTGVGVVCAPARAASAPAGRPTAAPSAPSRSATARRADPTSWRVRPCTRWRASTTAPVRLRR